MNPNNSQAIIDKIFAYDGLDRIDKETLVKKYDVTASIYEINAVIRSQKGPIPQTDNTISSIPPQGILIDAPGTYTFSSNLTWSQGPESHAAITIKANDVTLNMGGFNLAAAVSDTSQQIAGICVLESQKVTIQNGNLIDMCYYGIHAELVSDLTIENVTVSGLNFNNLAIRNLCPTGIHINAASAVTLSKCTVQYMYVTSDSSAGIQILNTTFGRVSDCRVSNLVNYDGSVQGYSYITSSEILTTNCSSDQFQSHFKSNIRTLGHTVLGFIPIFCWNLEYDNCSSTNMTGCCDDCHGMSIFLNAKVKVNNFTANTVTDGVSPSHSGAKATGLEVYGASVSIENSSVENIKAINPQDKQSTGFSAWGKNLTFTGCKAKNVTVCDENGKPSPALGNGTGFGWAPDPRPIFKDVGASDVQYTGCSVSDCQVAFDTWFHIDSTWKDVSYTNCGVNILVEPGATRTLSANPCSECNPPITAVIKNIASGNTYPGS